MPGTENSETSADKDVQKQLWDDKKVPTGQGRAAECTPVTQDLCLMIAFSSQDDSSKPNTCDVPGIKWVVYVVCFIILQRAMPLEYCAWSNMWTLVVCHIGRDTARLLGRNVRSSTGWRSFLEVVGSHWVKELQMICAPSDCFGVWISVT